MGELIQLALAVIAAGAIGGLLAGLFGIGGGAIVVPVLYQVLTFLGIDEAVRMHVSVASSIGIIVPTSIRSFLAHRARGAVDLDLLHGWLVALPIGVVIAAILAAFVSGGMLRGVFAVVALVFGIRLILNRDHWRLGDDLPGNPARAVVGGVIGFLSTLMGVGGGFLNNTFMTVFGRPIHQAVATSSGVGVLISIPAAVGYIIAGWDVPERPPWSLGYINLIAVALIMPVSVAAAPFGVRLAHWLAPRHLEIGFGLFLILVAIRFAISLI